MEKRWRFPLKLLSLLCILSFNVILAASLLSLFKVKNKFSIEDKNLILQDDTGVEVDEDVFTEVLEERSHDILWRVIDQDSGKSIQYKYFPSTLHTLHSLQK